MTLLFFQRKCKLCSSLLPDLKTLRAHHSSVHRGNIPLSIWVLNGNGSFIDLAYDISIEKFLPSTETQAVADIQFLIEMFSHSQGCFP